MDRTRSDDLTAQTFEITRDQARWLGRAAARSGGSPDALVRQAIEVLRRLSAYRDPYRTARRR